MNKIRIRDIIISAIAGICLWAYVISITNPVGTTVIRNVPVKLLNAETLQSSGLAIAGTGEYKVDLVVSGTRSERLGADASDFKATADVSNLTLGQGYINVNVSAPSALSVTEIRTQSIQVYVDKYVEKDMEISANVLGLAEGYELGKVSLSESSAKVCGAESLVSNVSKLVINVDVSNNAAGDAISSDFDVIPVDSEGEEVIGVSVSLGQVKFSAEVYILKTVALNVQLTNSLPSNIQKKTSIVPQSITIKGNAEDLDDIWLVKTEAIDLSTLTESQSIDVIPILPSGVEIADSSLGLTASFDLIVTSTQIFSFSTAEIELRDVPDEVVVDYKKDFNFFVTVTGEKNAMDQLTKEDITVFIVVGLDFDGSSEAMLQAEVNCDAAIDFTIDISPDSIDITAI